MRETKAKAMLDKVFFYKSKLREFEDDMEELMLQIGIKASGGSEVRGSESTQEDLICEKLDLENVIKNYKRLYKEARDEIFPYIEKMQDELYKKILLYRYIDAMSWKDIALRLSYTEDYLKGKALRSAIKILCSE